MTPVRLDDFYRAIVQYLCDTRRMSISDVVREGLIGLAQDPQYMRQADFVTWAAQNILPSLDEDRAYQFKLEIRRLIEKDIGPQVGALSSETQIGFQDLPTTLSSRQSNVDFGAFLPPPGMKIDSNTFQTIDAGAAGSWSLEGSDESNEDA